MLQAMLHVTQMSPCIFAATPPCPLSPPPKPAASLLRPRHSRAVAKTHRGQGETRTLGVTGQGGGEKIVPKVTPMHSPPFPCAPSP